MSPNKVSGRSKPQGTGLRLEWALPLALALDEDADMPERQRAVLVRELVASARRPLDVPQHLQLPGKLALGGVVGLPALYNNQVRAQGKGLITFALTSSSTAASFQPGASGFPIVTDGSVLRLLS
eukprot:CAMPEP_0115099826 /NCGR_PEP_ID=MMETSP0227-20121206/32123_1 /TAXON_ID=89957 /ORGANISM="Polarella glacialis, Strain CCMP 1383" /LENGTH=124 /DNA_ID=CAMNT_0002494971 /DNA_START=48 /DNA_END=424 /DNA_ORIENTATION=+